MEKKILANVKKSSVVYLTNSNSTHYNIDVCTIELTSTVCEIILINQL